MPVTTEPKIRKAPVPKQYDRILSGALKLQLPERVEMIKELTAENLREIDILDREEIESKERADKARNLVNGKD